MSKRISLMILFVVSLMLSVTGCSSSEDNSDDDKVLNILLEGGSPALEVAEQTAEEFESEFGYKIKIDSVPYTGVYDKLKAEIDAGIPIHDVAIIDVLWFSSLAKGLESLDDVLSDEELSDFLPQLKEGATINNELLGVPTWSNSKVLIYRKDLFDDKNNKVAFQEKYGYELKPPTNWQEYRDAAAFFTKDNMYGTTVFGANIGDSVSSWLDHVAQAGGSPLVIDESGNVLIDQKPYVEALEFLQNLISDKSVPSDTLSIASTETAELFGDERLAMMLVWGHFYMDAAEALPGKVGVAPMISGDAGIGAVPGPWYQVILKESAKKDVARDYLKFMYSKNEEYMRTLGISGRSSIFDSYDGKEEYLHLGAINETLGGNQTQNRPQINEWTRIENEILAPMIQRALSGKDAKTELIKAKQQIEQLLNR